MATLTDKQEKFCIKYVECGNASEAYRYAYNCGRMKPETINRCAKELLDNPKITTRIKELQAKVADELLVSDKSVLREHARIGFSDIRKVFDEQGNLKPIHELDNDTAAAIQSTKVSIKSLGDGEVEYVKEIKFWSKPTALEALSKHLGLFEKDNEQKKTEGVDPNAISSSVRAMLDAIYQQNRSE